jgi:4-hydroxybenzoate polyprenyltransferase
MKTEAQSLGAPAAVSGTFRHLLAAARPREWIKNTFIFAPLFFSQNLLNPEFALKSACAFVLFCLAAGGVYLVNDIWDRRQDEKHPLKRTRPIASGALSAGVAATAAVIFYVIAVAGGAILKPMFGVVIFAYVILSFAYSKWLKHAVILDVFSIAAGFVLRVVAGAVVIDVMMSHWLLICTMLLALFLGFSKRRCELVALATDASLHRRVLTEYDAGFLDMMIAIVTSATVIAYTLYTVSDETVQRFHTDRLLWTLPFVLYGIFRYLYLVYHKNSGGNPSQVLVSDAPLLVSIFLWGLACGFIIYTAHP